MIQPKENLPLPRTDTAHISASAFWLIAVLLLAAQLILNYPLLIAHLSTMNMWDEAEFINHGRLWAEGQWPQFAQNPLMVALYAVIYLFCKSSPLWLVHCCTVGRFVLFGLLWGATCLIAKRLTAFFHPVIMLGVAFLSPALTELLRNPSDALFAAMAAFGFSQLLAYREHGKPSDLLLASCFVGLASLARIDGLVLFVFFSVLSFLLFRRGDRRFRCCAAILLPFLTILGVYMGLYALLGGGADTGLAEKSYLPFEQAQGVVYELKYPNQNPYLEGQVQARALYGTPEQNHYSILAAIRRNPQAFLNRVGQVVRTIPFYWLGAYGSGLGLVLFLLLGRGIIALAFHEEPALLALALIWPLHLSVHLLTYFRPGHFLLAYFALFTLASIGLNTVMFNRLSRRERIIWIIALGDFIVCGWAMAKLEWVTAAALFLAALLLGQLVIERGCGRRWAKAAGCLIFLVLGLWLKGYFAICQTRIDTSAPLEQTASFLEKNFAPGSAVGAYAPGVVYLARMRYVPLNINLRSMTAASDLSSWMKNVDISAVYVDQGLRQFEPRAWRLLQSEIGNGLTQIYISSDSQHTILIRSK